MNERKNNKEIVKVKESFEKEFEKAEIKLEKKLTRTTTPFGQIWGDFKKKKKQKNSKTILKKESNVNNGTGCDKDGNKVKERSKFKPNNSFFSNFFFSNFSYLFRITSKRKLIKEDLAELPKGIKMKRIKEKVKDHIDKLERSNKSFNDANQIIYHVIRDKMRRAILLKCFEQILTLMLTLQFLNFLPKLKSKIKDTGAEGLENAIHDKSNHYFFFSEIPYFFIILPISSGIIAFLRYLVKEHSGKYVNQSVSTTNQVLRYLLFQKMVQANISFLRNADNSLVTRMSIFKFEAIVQFLGKIPDLFAFPIILILSVIVILTYVSFTALISFLIFCLTSLVLVYHIKGLSKKNLKYEYCGSLRSLTIHELIEKLLVVKLDSMDNILSKKISNLRVSEVTLLKKIYSSRAFGNFIMSLSPILSSLVIILIENMIRSENLSVTETVGILSIIANLQKPLKNFVVLSERFFAFQYAVSCMNNFLFGIPDKPNEGRYIQKRGNGKIVIKNATTELDDDEEMLEELKTIFGFDKYKIERKKSNAGEMGEEFGEPLDSAKMPLENKASINNDIASDNEGGQTKALDMMRSMKTLVIPNMKSTSRKVRKRIVNISLDLEIQPKEKILVASNFGNISDSEFLLNLLGETRISEGLLQVYGNIGFVDLGNFHFLKGESIKENVLMGEKFFKSRYKEICGVCGLEMSKFPGGDMMQILKDGVNLDDEDAMKVLLARTLYRDNDIYLINGKFEHFRDGGFFEESEFYSRIVEKQLKDKTVIITGKAEKLSSLVDRCFLIEEGMVKEVTGILDEEEVTDRIFNNILQQEKHFQQSSSRYSAIINNGVLNSNRKVSKPSLFSPKFKPRKIGISSPETKMRKLDESLFDEKGIEMRMGNENQAIVRGGRKETPVFQRLQKNKMKSATNKAFVSLSSFRKQFGADDKVSESDEYNSVEAFKRKRNKVRTQSPRRKKNFNPKRPIIRPRPLPIKIDLNNSVESYYSSQMFLENRNSFDKFQRKVSKRGTIHSPTKIKRQVYGKMNKTTSYGNLMTLQKMTDGGQIIGHLFQGFLSVKERKEKGMVVNVWDEDEVYNDLIGTLMRYIFIKGKRRVILQLAFLFLTTFLLLFLDFWVGAWSTNLFPNLGATKYTIVYIFLSLLSLLSLLLKDKSFYTTFMKNSNTIHNEMVEVLFNTDHEWLSTHPSTQIKYKLSYDMRKIDTTLNVQLQAAFEGIVMVIVGLLVTNYVFVGLFFFFGIFMFIIARRKVQMYVKATQSLMQFISENNALMQAVFNETLEEALSFRVIGKLDILENKFKATSDQLQRVITHLNFYSKRWLGIRLGIVYSISTAFVYLIPVIHVYFLNEIFDRDLLQYALGVSWGLKLLGSLESSLFMFLEAYIQTASFGRLEHFSLKAVRDDRGLMEISQKNAYEMPIISKNVSVSFHDFKLLQELSFNVKAKTKLALIGDVYYSRINLIKLILGIYSRDPTEKETETSVFKIFGSDIDKISKKELRSNISYLDKEPTLIAGTVRQNIDPKSEFSESELLWFMNKLNILSSLSNGKKTQLLMEGRFQSRMLFGNQDMSQSDAMSLIKEIYTEIADDFVVDPFLRKAIRDTKFETIDRIGMYNEEVDISVKKTENVEKEEKISVKYKGRRKGVNFNNLLNQNFLFQADKEEKTKILFRKKLSDKNFKIAENEILKNLLKLKIGINDTLISLRMKRMIKALGMLLSKANLVIIDEEALEFGDGNLETKIQHILEIKKDSTVIFLLNDLSKLSNFDEYIMISETGKIDFKGKTADCLSNYRSNLSKSLIEKDKKLYKELRIKAGIDKDEEEIGLWDEQNCDYNSYDFDEMREVSLMEDRRENVDDTKRNINVGLVMWPEVKVAKEEVDFNVAKARKKYRIFSFKDI